MTALDSMLRDRPKMRFTLPNNHSLFDWVVAKFTDPLRWDKEEPETGFAEHVWQTDDECRIRVTSAIGGVDQWALLVFEIYNSQQGAQFKLARTLILKNRISAVKYSSMCTSFEFLALRFAAERIRATPIRATGTSNQAWHDWLVTEDFATMCLSEAGQAAWEKCRKHYAMEYDQIAAAVPNRGYP